MIQVKRKKFNKKQSAIIIAASVLVVLTVASILVSMLLGNDDQMGVGAGTPPEIKPGEALYANRVIAYPYVQKSQIISVAVKSHADEFLMGRLEDVGGNLQNYFTLFYTDENGEPIPYYPDIMSKENDTKYTDFYAIENSDGLNVTKIDYLCAAIGALYVDQRIEPEENKDAQLKRYGLDPESREVIYFSYLTADGKKAEHTIYVGDSLINGVGYYFMIAGRDYIYTSAASERLNYLLGDFEDFLHSRLIPQGLPGDSIYEPYLTTDYKQWINRYFGINSGGAGMYPTKDSEVIVVANVKEPIYDADGQGDGYFESGYTTISMNLNELANRQELLGLHSLLLSTPVGNYEKNEINHTVIRDSNTAELGSEYTYVIYAVEEKLSSDLVKVKYVYYVDGKVGSTEPCHAVLDLNSPHIPSNIKTALRTAEVGDDLSGDGNLSFKITYDESNAGNRDVKLIITDILMISKLDENGGVSYLDAVTEDSIVTYAYKYLIDGEDVGREGMQTVDLSKVTEGDDLKIKNELIGLKVQYGMNKTVLDGKVYCQIFKDFISYSIRQISGYLTKEMVVSFEFVNASLRDPFYGESIYANTLENENRFLALDAYACQMVTFLLGGIGESSSSQMSAGLLGNETVALGLTPENMDRFGLYDGYTVYFELPRGITSVEGSESDELADYTYLDKLGCYLYISKLQSDGTRYIGSSLYDIIVKIDGERFNYLEKSFEDYWARKNLVMIDYTIIDKVTAEFNMTDVYGKYEFGLDHRTIYIVGNEHFDTKPEQGGQEYHFITVNTRPLSSSLSETEFSKIIKAEGRESLTLENLYNRVAGKPVAVNHDTAGTAYFKKILSLMYGTNYSGALADEEIDSLVENAPKIISLTFNLIDVDHGYRYDFYRVSDSRVMVHIYRVDSYGDPVDDDYTELSGFFISTFAAKKIVNAFMTVLNGKVLNEDLPYWS